MRTKNVCSFRVIPSIGRGICNQCFPLPNDIFCINTICSSAFVEFWRIQSKFDKFVSFITKTMLFNCKESAMSSFITYVHYIVLSFILKKTEPVLALIYLVF